MGCYTVVIEGGGEMQIEAADVCEALWLAEFHGRPTLLDGRTPQVAALAEALAQYGCPN